MQVPEPISWTSSSRTDVGMVRDHNEDACLDRPDLGLWVVADGMGGHHAGDVASGMIVERLAEIEPPDDLGTFVEALEDRLIAVNAKLREIAAREEVHTIGSTVAALMARGRHAVCAWAGDSRIYLYRGGKLERFTQDHALVEELVEKGVLTREQAVNHPQGNLVTRAVGATDRLLVDFEIVELEPGDRFVLCSDGLDKELDEAEIAGVLSREDEASLSDVLVDLALSRGSRDNVTVVTVAIGGSENAAVARPVATAAETVATPSDAAESDSEETVPGYAAKPRSNDEPV